MATPFPIVLLIVARYGDLLETFETQEAALRFIKRFLPLLPDAVWDEGPDCETVTEYDVVVTAGEPKLVALTHL